MIFTGKQALTIKILTGVGLGGSILLGIFLGLALGFTSNTELTVDFEEETFKPTWILDRNQEVITKFYAEEYRELVALSDVPKTMIDALTTREDAEFFHHNGFSLWGTMRAAFMIVTGQLFSGGSTLTQQLSGKRYSDRTELSISRKLEELWWAFQMEKNLTKYEILEQYVNKMPFGHGTYGIEAASQYFFNHSASELSLAESAMLAIQLVKPNLYSPIRRPRSAKRIQGIILAEMVRKGWVDKYTARDAFAEYWRNHDWSRDNFETAFFNREDRAPHFSEYVRTQLENSLTGTADIYRDGYTVHTSLDLGIQEIADQTMSEGLSIISSRFKASANTQSRQIQREVMPLVDMLGLGFNIEGIKASRSSLNRLAAQDIILEEIVPTLDVLGSTFGLEGFKEISRNGFALTRQMNKERQVQGAMVALDNRTGHILAMVGGAANFDGLNQFNRAVNGAMEPGSTFKPLFYSQAISSRKFTAGSLIYDEPVFFENEDGTFYTPQNYKGYWSGKTVLRDALINSMNVPAVTVLDEIGFDAAINRASRMLGVNDPAEVARTFPRKYPLALGVVSVSPLQMARAFMIFPNQGMEKDPIAIDHIIDQENHVILNPYEEASRDRTNRWSDYQVMDQASAYVMTNILESAVIRGTLRSSRVNVDGFDGVPMAGKTGTTQNWADAWTVGFSPYMTSAFWFGFDRSGQSLGLYNTGATAAGPVWANFMKKSHEVLRRRAWEKARATNPDLAYEDFNLPIQEFQEPPTGIVRTTIDLDTGLLASPLSQRTRYEVFIEGTAPRETSQSYYVEKEAQLQTMMNTIANAHPEETYRMNDLSIDISLDPNLGRDANYRPVAVESEAQDEDPFGIDFLDIHLGDDPYRLDDREFLLDSEAGSTATDLDSILD
jgi:penicillin-binding protein 1A